jgi:hypothetical protein
MQLYEKALDVFEDDPATSVSCYRHHPHKISLLNNIAAFTYGPFSWSVFLFPGYITQASAKNSGHTNSGQDFAYSGNSYKLT